MSDYERIAKAIDYIGENVTAQPSLADVAAHVHLSPFHFQRLFSRWAGTTPKRFLQVLTLELGKRLLEESASLLEVADDARSQQQLAAARSLRAARGGDAGRVPQQGQGPLDPPRRARYAVRQTVHCTNAARRLPCCVRRRWRRGCGARPARSRFGRSRRSSGMRARLRTLPRCCRRPCETSSARCLCTSRAPIFRLRCGGPCCAFRPLAAVTYSQIAEAVGSPRAVRAAGSAIGANPVALLIPCHRVIQQSGGLGGYRWGAARKQAIQVWERLRTTDKTSIKTI